MMNDLRFALRQLLKNPGHITVAVLMLARTSRLLPSKDAPNLPVSDAYLNDHIPAAATEIVARTIANSPKNLARTEVLRDRDQVLVDFHAFPSGAFVGCGHRAGQRHGQIVFQDCVIQNVWHAMSGSGLRQGRFGCAQFNDTTRWRDKVEERGRNNKLAHIRQRLQVRIIAHGAFVRLARFLEEIRPRIGVGVKRGDYFQFSQAASVMGRDIDRVSGAFRPADHLQRPCGSLNNEASLFVSARRTGQRLAPGQSQGSPNIWIIEKGFDAHHALGDGEARKDRLQERTTFLHE